MIFRLLRRNPSAASIEALYGAIVAQARLPSFYLRYGVADTPDGRFEMVVVHLFLLLHRLGAAADAPADLKQELFDVFCRDLDHNLREMGVGDLTVPRKMRGYAEAFYGRCDAYGAALASSDRAAAAAALARNVYSLPQASDGALLLAHYTMQAAQILAEQPIGGIVRGGLRFPDPDTMAAVS